MRRLLDPRIWCVNRIPKGSPRTKSPKMRRKKKKWKERKKVIGIKN